MITIKRLPKTLLCFLLIITVIFIPMIKEAYALTVASTLGLAGLGILTLALSAGMIFDTSSADFQVRSFNEIIGKWLVGKYGLAGLGVLGFLAQIRGIGTNETTFSQQITQAVATRIDEEGTGSFSIQYCDSCSGDGNVSIYGQLEDYVISFGRWGSNYRMYSQISDVRLENGYYNIYCDRITYNYGDGSIDGSVNGQHYFRIPATNNLSLDLDNYYLYLSYPDSSNGWSARISCVYCERDVMGEFIENVTDGIIAESVIESMGSIPRNDTKIIGVSSSVKSDYYENIDSLTTAASGYVVSGAGEIDYESLTTDGLDFGTYENTGTGTIPGTPDLTGVMEGISSIDSTVSNIDNVIESATTFPATTEGLHTLNLSRLSSVFPFSIPFDIYRILNSFNAQRETPIMTLNIPNPASGTQESLTLDFTEFNTIASIVRTLEFIGFAVGLALITRKLIWK